MPQKPDSYHRPESVDEALALLAKPGAAPLGGGTKLLASETGLPHTAVIDLQSLGLSRAKLVTANNLKNLAVGATYSLAKFNQFMQSELPSDPAAALLTTAIRLSGPNTYRNAATLGGTVASRLPDSELLATLLVLEATITLRSLASQNTMSVADYLAAEERPSGLITTVTIPLPSGNGACHRVARTPADYSIVSVTGWRPPDGTVRLAATGVGQRPFRLYSAEQALSAGIEPAAAAAKNANSHPGDFRGSASYRAEMAAVLTRRILSQLN